MNDFLISIYGFQQAKLLQFNLDNDDALVLRVIKDMYSSSSIEFIIHEKDKYIWINYSTLLEYIPIIGSMSKLKRKVKNLCILGFLDKTIKNNKGKTTDNFEYIKPTAKLDKINLT